MARDVDRLLRYAIAVVNPLGRLMSDTHNLMVRVPERLKAKIAAAVKRQKLNMNDVVVQILADRYSLHFEPSRGRVKEVGPSPQIVLVLPAHVYEAVNDDASSAGDSMRNRIVLALSEHFRVPYKPTARWPKKAVRA